MIHIGSGACALLSPPTIRTGTSARLTPSSCFLATNQPTPAALERRCVCAFTRSPTAQHHTDPGAQHITASHRPQHITVSTLDRLQAEADPKGQVLLWLPSYRSSSA